MIDRLKARMLLSECTGRHLWPVEHCRKAGVPQDWIEQLQDCYESGFRTDLERLYTDAGRVNQFHGVWDLQLARRLGEFLGVNIPYVTQTTFSAIAEVRAIQEAADEL